MKSMVDVHVICDKRKIVRGWFQGQIIASDAELLHIRFPLSADCYDGRFLRHSEQLAPFGSATARDYEFRREHLKPGFEVIAHDGYTW